MKKTLVQADLSGWLSPDEERLLNLYRDSCQEDRNQFLYHITRRRFAPFFAEQFDKTRDAVDPTYLEEELEQELRIICPSEYLGEFLSEEPHRLELLTAAWGRVAPVILGASEQDGQRADELYNTAIRLWDMLGNSPCRRMPMKLSRKDALAFIEAWREAVLELVFRHQDD
jgi:hypothetical protein